MLTVQKTELVMRAVLIRDDANGPHLSVETIADPEMGRSDLLISVRAAGVNRIDLARKAKYFEHAAGNGIEQPTVAGLEIAGEVIAVGDQVSNFKAGDRVMAMVSGGYAERTVVDHRLALPVSAGMAWEDAAATPVAFLTAHDALFTNGGMKPGKSVLIHAVASGVGLAALQIAKCSGASLVIGTAGSREKLDRARTYFLDLGIYYKSEAFADHVLAATSGNGVDIILDMVGGSALPDNMRCATFEGKIISIGRLGGAIATIDLDQLSMRRLHLVGVTFRSRSVVEHGGVVRRFFDGLWPGLNDGHLRPVIDRVFSLEEADAAQAYMRSNANVGKIVLRVDP
jgi:NADPH2:quinone reductase